MAKRVRRSDPHGDKRLDEFIERLGIPLQKKLSGFSLNEVPFMFKHTNEANKPGRFNWKSLDLLDQFTEDNPDCTVVLAGKPKAKSEHEYFWIIASELLSARHRKPKDGSLYGAISIRSNDNNPPSKDKWRQLFKRSRLTEDEIRKKLLALQIQK